MNLKGNQVLITKIHAMQISDELLRNWVKRNVKSCSHTVLSDRMKPIPEFRLVAIYKRLGEVIDKYEKSTNETVVGYADNCKRHLITIELLVKDLNDKHNTK